MGLDAVSFDLDETLLFYRRSPAELLETSFARIGEEAFFTAEEYTELFDQYVGPGDTIEEVRIRCFTHLARENDRDPGVGRELAEAYSAARDHGNVELYPGAEDVLSRCAAAFDLALITNGPRNTQVQKLAATGIESYFDFIVYAGDETPPKPEPDPFERSLDALSVTPDRAIHVGNSLEADVRGALDVGMAAIWVTNGETGMIDVDVPRITYVGELLDLPHFEA